MMEKGEGQPGRIRRLDGIRAVAILLVFMIHDGFGRFGWTGVPLFFVLSGFFITGILRRKREEQSFWTPFYVKRATRILPPLVIAFVAAGLFSNVAWRQVGLYELFFTANIAEVVHRGQTGTLSVMWSLAVEEQFYLFWPFAIRYLNRRRLIQVLAVTLMVEPILRAAFSPIFHTIWPIFYLTPFQLDGLAAGSLMALLVEKQATADVLTRWCGWALGTAVVLSSLLFTLPGFNRDANTVYFNSLGYTFVNIACCSLITYVLLRPQRLLSRILGCSQAVFLGSVSYGFYLFHLAAINLVSSLGSAHHFRHNRTLAPLTFIITVVFSWGSFRFYEAPIIAWGKRWASNIQASRWRALANV